MNKIKEIINDEDILVAPIKGVQRSAAVYLMLAFFLGVLGVHNFYAGYVGRGLVQLFLTLISAFFMFIPLMIVVLWVFLEICFVREDSLHVPFVPAPIVRIVAIVAYILSFSSVSYMSQQPQIIWVMQETPAVVTEVDVEPVP